MVKFIDIEGFTFIDNGHIFVEACSACGGTGYRPQYSHIDKGACFYCQAHGFESIAPMFQTLDGAQTFIKNRLKRRAQSARRRELREEKKEQERRDREAQWMKDRLENSTDCLVNGAVGDKIEGTFTVNHIFEGTDNFGYTPTHYKLFIIKNNETGESAKVKTTARWAKDVAKGDTVTIKATIKSHGEYKGLPQTTLTRAQRIA